MKHWHVQVDAKFVDVADAVDAMIPDVTIFKRTLKEANIFEMKKKLTADC